MKKILKYSLLTVLGLVVAVISGCQKSEYDTDQINGFSLAALAPNPVMRGGTLRIFGSSLDQVKEVIFAGDVSVTEFVELRKGAKLDTLELVVPLEGPEVGKVTIVAKDGRKLSSMADLTFTESIEFTSLTPATALSGDILTFTGEYLNIVKEVIFSGDNAVSVKFESQDRHELKVKVPANAISGPVILSDVNEIQDQNTIPNHIYGPKDLTVGDPTVNKAAKATYKSGDVITVTGAHLDMIKNVAVPQVSEVDFKLAEDLKSISFNLPAKASDGNITLTSFAGKDFDAGEIETVNVTALTVKSLAEDARFKAGCEVEITGEDLDLVTKVEFTGAEASYSMDSEGKIIAVQPATAKDGAITVTLDSGKQAYSEDIEVVKPVVSAVDKTEAVAGADVIVVSGEDLDLVSAAKIGDKAQGFIECAFEFAEDDDKNVQVKVSVPAQAYTGPITLTADNGYETVTDNITVTYDMAVSVKFDLPSYGLGNNISITGKNLMQVEQVFVKGKKVTSFAVRADDAMAFALPEGIGPGVYRLSFILIDGTELTWPVPFEVTAPFTETFYWEGYEDLESWGPQPYLGADGALAGNIVVGDLIRIYYTPYADGWQFEIFDGHWGAMTFPELGGGNAVKASNTDPDAQYFAFEVTEANIGALTTSLGWGGIFVVQGESVIITAVSVIHFGAAEKKTVIWEGNVTVDWRSDPVPGSEGSMSALSWGGYDWGSVSAGATLILTFERGADEVQIRLGNGGWTALPGTEDPYKPEGTELRVELTAEMIAEMVDAGGLVVTGQGFTLTEVALATVESVGPQENIIWEGSVTVWWGDAGSEALKALAYGGYDWSTVEAGTILCAHYTIDEAEGGCIRFGNGGWASIPSLAGLAADGNLPLVDGGTHEVELTAEDLEFLVANDGLVICGNGYTITSVGLK